MVPLNALFEFKQPIIISKSPIIVYAFQLINTCSIDKTYSDKVDYETIVNDNKEFIFSLVGSFCEKCSKYFSRPLDIDRLLSRLVHSDYTVNAESGDDATSEPVIYEWKYTPYRIIISGTELKVEWCLDQVEIKCLIDISADETDAVNVTTNELTTISLNREENNGDMASFEKNDEVPPDVQLAEVNIPVSEDSTPIAIKMDGRSEDYKHLKKAQLRVEMAKFKAERAYAKYVERWGYLSEDSGSESE